MSTVVSGKHFLSGSSTIRFRANNSGIIVQPTSSVVVSAKVITITLAQVPAGFSITLQRPAIRRYFDKVPQRGTQGTVS
jgi:hypothetical protein